MAQSYKSHTRWDPAFHFFIAPVLLINIILAITYCVKHYDRHRHLAPWAIVMSFVLFVMAAKIRSYPLIAQDRAIRLEEKMRLASLATPAELVELDSLTMKQYVALRFASNPEVLDLARRAVREKLEPKQIKEAIKSWRADEYRV